MSTIVAFAARALGGPANRHSERQHGPEQGPENALHNHQQSKTLQQHQLDINLGIYRIPCNNIITSFILLIVQCGAYRQINACCLL